LNQKGNSYGNSICGNYIKKHGGRGICQGWTAQGAEDALLGAIPLEDMDLMVNPVTQELIGIHGDIVEHIAM